MLNFDGWIVSACFARGDVVVAGLWPRSPFGPVADVMWSTSAGERVLLAPTDEFAGFVSRHYTFDRVDVVDVRARLGRGSVAVDAGPLVLRVALGRAPAASLALRLRPRTLLRTPRWLDVEDALLRPLAGPIVGGGANVRTSGTTMAGVRQRYAIRDLRWVTSATGAAAGADLGELDRIRHDPGFGFSGPPRRPAAVRVTAMLDV